jgi:hypothetical protein
MIANFWHQRIWAEKEQKNEKETTALILIARDTRGTLLRTRTAIILSICCCEQGKNPYLFLPGVRCCDMMKMCAGG